LLIKPGRLRYVKSIASDVTSRVSSSAGAPRPGADVELASWDR
jgi:hypothetical protein